MSAQEQHIQILDFIRTEEIKSLFSNSYSCKNRVQAASMQYRRNDSLLSAICDDTVFNLINWLTIFSDYFVLRKIQKATYRVQLPLKLRIVEAVALLLAMLPLATMILDFYFSWTNLSAFSYLYASVCGFTLYATTKIAKREWMDHKRNERQK